MSDYMVIVEADFRKTNMNYSIRRSGALPRAAAEELFERVVQGHEPDLLKPRKDAVLARTADNQVYRFWTGLTQAESMDRITLGEVLA